VQQGYLLESNLDERPFMEPALRAVGVARSIGYKSMGESKERNTNEETRYRPGVANRDFVYCPNYR
jgi:hypothetical protein